MEEGSVANGHSTSSILQGVDTCTRVVGSIQLRPCVGFLRVVGLMFHPALSAPWHACCADNSPGLGPPVVSLGKSHNSRATVTLDLSLS